jgi:L-lactate dehydrogenase
MRIGVVGMGWVGSSVAISTLQSGLPTELLVSDMKPGLAEGEAMDLAHGAAFYATATVRAARPDEMLDADAVVVSAGRGGKPGESRRARRPGNPRGVGAHAPGPARVAPRPAP